MKNLNKHCCQRMEDAVNSTCEHHTDRHECPDCLIDYNCKFDEFGIVIHDSGSSVLTIDFCPWCGSKLPESRRDEWFDELENIGITDPQDQTIPAKYLTDEWYRNKVSTRRHTVSATLRRCASAPLKKITTRIYR